MRRKKIVISFVSLPFIVWLCLYLYEIQYFKSYIPKAFGSLRTAGICTHGWLLGGWGHAAFKFDKNIQAKIQTEGLNFFVGATESERLPQIIGTGKKTIKHESWRKIVERDLSNGLPIYGCTGGLSNNTQNKLLEAVQKEGGFVALSSVSGMVYVIPSQRFVIYTYMD